MYIHRYACGLSLQLGPLTLLHFYQENSFASMLSLFRVLIKVAKVRAYLYSAYAAHMPFQSFDSKMMFISFCPLVPLAPCPLSP